MARRSSNQNVPQPRKRKIRKKRVCERVKESTKKKKNEPIDDERTKEKKITLNEKKESEREKEVEFGETSPVEPLPLSSFSRSDLAHTRSQGEVLCIWLFETAGDCGKKGQQAVRTIQCRRLLERRRRRIGRLPFLLRRSLLRLRLLLLSSSSSTGSSISSISSLLMASTPRRCRSRWGTTEEHRCRCRRCRCR